MTTPTSSCLRSGLDASSCCREKVPSMVPAVASPRICSMWLATDGEVWSSSSLASAADDPPIWYA
eukprot:CAMPEP_0174705206 /NCGR_PEP_ID=MMETSP1094-20130205/8517_1 /TAXON_ID=156173 /ORGANISM="Chrysochromulina brevifilum, Strain UTEX LB 985" /LENGTH=64 /DNA_ID=CAMNT_0015903339 /DNA_START=218 /DNA_END=412 /DNA_ORIENTATION=+